MSPKVKNAPTIIEDQPKLRKGGMAIRKKPLRSGPSSSAVAEIVLETSTVTTGNRVKGTAIGKRKKALGSGPSSSTVAEIEQENLTQTAGANRVKGTAIGKRKKALGSGPNSLAVAEIVPETSTVTTGNRVKGAAIGKRKEALEIGPSIPAVAESVQENLTETAGANHVEGTATGKINKTVGSEKSSLVIVAEIEQKNPTQTAGANHVKGTATVKGKKPLRSGPSSSAVAEIVPETSTVTTGNRVKGTAIGKRKKALGSGPSSSTVAEIEQENPTQTAGANRVKGTAIGKRKKALGSGPNSSAVAEIVPETSTVTTGNRVKGAAIGKRKEALEIGPSISAVAESVQENLTETAGANHVEGTATGKINKTVGSEKSSLVIVAEIEQKNPTQTAGANHVKGTATGKINKTVGSGKSSLVAVRSNSGLRMRIKKSRIPGSNTESRSNDNAISSNKTSPTIAAILSSISNENTPTSTRMRGAINKNEVAENTSPTIAEILANSNQIHEHESEHDRSEDGNSCGNLSDMNESSNSDVDSDSGEEVSDSDDISEAETRVQPKTARWLLEKTFENKDKMNEFLAKENCWSYRTSNQCNDGRKVLYRCNKIKRASKTQCEAGIYIIEVTDRGSDIDEMTPQYMLFRKNCLHTHQFCSDLRIRLPDQTKNRIIEQYKNGRKPKAISYALLDDAAIPNEEKPSYKQIVRVIENFKKSGCGVEPISMRQISKFVDQHSTVPIDEDEPFIVNFERSPKTQKNDKYFRLFISTKRLLRMAKGATIIHADSTHKVTTEKVPLIAVGVTDPNRKFHFSGLSLSTREAKADYELDFQCLKEGVQFFTGTELKPKFLVCDGDVAIHNAFESAFGYDEEMDDDVDIPRYTIIMCYFHVLLNIQKKYKFKVSGNRKLFKADIRELHLCASEKQFDVGCSLFVKKWENVEPEATNVIQHSFFRKHKNWFIGCAPRVPKCNSCLECFNSTLKRCQTEHRRLPMKQFLKKSISIVRQRSKEYLLDKLEYSSVLEVPDDIMKQGHELNLKFVYKPENDGENFEFFAFSSLIDEEISLQHVEMYENWNFTSFDEFKNHHCDIWQINFPHQSDEWTSATCSCPMFDKNFICKHIISIAVSLRLLPELEHEMDYDDEALFPTKRGRPKKTSKALVKE